MGTHEEEGRQVFWFAFVEPQMCAAVRIILNGALVTLWSVGLLRTLSLVISVFDQWNQHFAWDENVQRLVPPRLKHLTVTTDAINSSHITNCTGGSGAPFLFVSSANCYIKILPQPAFMLPSYINFKGAEPGPLRCTIFDYQLLCQPGPARPSQPLQLIAACFY